MAPQAILHDERNALLKSSRIGVETAIDILGVDTLKPSHPQLQLHDPTSKRQPRLVEVVALRVRS